MATKIVDNRVNFASVHNPYPYPDFLDVPFVVERHLEDIFPLTTLEFEGYQLPVPGNYDKVLTDQYGDYMQLPDLDKVNLHVGKLEFKS